MSKRPNKTKAGAPGQIRIIGGQWRGRKLPVPNAEGLRPTPDRVRETLFNWLQFSLVGKTCLDAFAGSGALTLEALSRGAAQVIAIEKDIKVTQQLTKLFTPLAGESLKLINADALEWLAKTPAQAFELVFLDPPFGQALLEPACQLLEEGGWLAEGALIYLEQAKGQSPSIKLPSTWVLEKDKQIGDVHFSLYTR